MPSLHNFYCPRPADACFDRIHAFCLHGPAAERERALDDIQGSSSGSKRRGRAHNECARVLTACVCACTWGGCMCACVRIRRGARSIPTKREPNATANVGTRAKAMRNANERRHQQRRRRRRHWQRPPPTRQALRTYRSFKFSPPWL